jgi:hypothetical protein
MVHSSLHPTRARRQNARRDPFPFTCLTTCLRERILSSKSIAKPIEITTFVLSARHLYGFLGRRGTGITIPDSFREALDQPGQRSFREDILWIIVLLFLFLDERPCMKRLTLMVFLVLLAVAADVKPLQRTGPCITNSSGQTVCPEPGSACLQDHRGKIACSPPDGGIVRDLHGNFLCGPGQCVQNVAGRVSCSSLPGGVAKVDVNGKFVCSRRCVPGSPSLCRYHQ